jgi:hypothetical protein
MLVKLPKYEYLPPIYVPEPKHQAVPHLSHIREVTLKDLKGTKHQLKVIMLRNISTEKPKITRVLHTFVH